MLFKRISWLVIFVIGQFAALALNEADSLKKVISSSAAYKPRIDAYIMYADKYNLKDFDETISITDEGIRLANLNNDNISAAVLKEYKGTAYYFKGKYDVAARLYYEAISTLEKTTEKKKLAVAYNELAKLYRKTRDLDRALANYDKALAIYTGLKDSVGIAMINNESGVVFEYKKDYNEAIRRYSVSLAIDASSNDTVGMSYAYSNLGGVFLLLNRFTEAESSMLQSLAIRRRINDEFMLGITYSDIANIYMAAGNYQKALANLDSSNTIGRKMHYTELLATNYKLLSDLEKKRGNYKNAFQYLETERALHDSLINKEKVNQIEELNTKYETVKKEQVIEQQKYEIIRRNYWIIASSAVFLVLLISGVSAYRRNKLKEQTKLQRAIVEQKELAMKAVLQAEENERQRIAKDLHDGVGQIISAARMNLSALESNLTFTNQKHQTSYSNILKLVDDSCKEIRTVSHNMMPNALLTENLAGALKKFINQLSDGGLKINLFTEGLNEKLDSSIETVLYRVIQECVNNVIKHSGADSLDISVIRDADGINATIEDNGKGYDTSKGYEGIGLKNIRTRVEYLKGEVEFTSSPGRGTLISLHIPDASTIVIK
jgi:two-component system, NarL family, sensor kinase